LAPILALLFTISASSGDAQSGRPVVDPALGRMLEGGGLGETRAILTFEQRPGADQVQRVRDLGLAVHTFDVLPMLGVEGTTVQIEGALALDGLVSVWKDQELEYLLHESRPLIGANAVANRLGYRGNGIGVAVLDSGVDGTNPDVSYPGRLVQNVKITGVPDPYDEGNGFGITYVEDQKNTDTSSGHGTHVAGTIGGSGKASGGYYTGIAPKSDLVGIGAGDTLFILYALEGFDYALKNQKKYDIRVISNSWGTSGKFEKEDPINVASKKAYKRGITVVFAAGNAGPEKDTLNPYSVAPWVIGVAAGDKQRRLADFSSRGRPGSKLYAPDITAPGVDIVSARASTGATINALTAADDATYIPPEYLPYYTTASGTSMATPHVSGTVALMEQANGSLGPDRIRKILKSTATDMPGRQTYEVGAGYLNAFKATKAAENAN
jgi:serine protease AprX